MFEDMFELSTEKSGRVWQEIGDLIGISLFAVVGDGLLAGPLDFPLVVRWLFAFPLLCFVPGYALLSALFPATGRPERRETVRGASLPTLDRLALSVATSLAIVALLAVVSNALWELSLAPVLGLVALSTIGASVAGVLRRDRVAPENRFSPLLSRRLSGLSAPVSGTGKFAVVAAVVGLSLAAGGFAIAGTSSEPVTEFYLTNGSSGQLGAADANGTQQVVVEHQRSQSAEYTVVVRQHDDNGSQVLDRTRIQVGGEDMRRVQVPTPESDAKRIEYLLFEGTPENTDSVEPSRRLVVRPDEPVSSAASVTPS